MNGQSEQVSSYLHQSPLCHHVTDVKLHATFFTMENITVNSTQES